jgi:hypothetical protein
MNSQLEKDFEKIIDELKNNGIDDTTIESIKKLKYSNEDVSEIMNEVIREANEAKKKRENKQKTDDLLEQERTYHLWEMADENILGMITSRTSIFLDVTIGREKVRCLLDTGAQNNIITMDIIKKCGLESFVDRSYRTKVIGVGESNIIGCIPYITINIDGVECPCYFQVMDKIASKDILLGLPFMMFYQVVLDFKKQKMIISGKEVKMIIKEPDYIKQIKETQ